MALIPYTLFFIGTFFCLTAVTVVLDFIQHRLAKHHYIQLIKENRKYLYVYLFKVLAEVALIWLIVAFIGQIWMGWIKF
ncbi:MAG: hypothetical protein DRJ49_06910 [Thermoprotei archaeon]|nr:MAG: hypothetical protein DRJ49_06910 [Thermoprotei archaeon]